MKLLCLIYSLIGPAIWVFGALDESRAPGKPQDVQVEVFSDKALVRWKPPKNANSVAIREYIIGWDDYLLAVSKDVLEQLCDSLLPDTEYNATVMASNDAGEGEVVQISFRTLPEVDQKVDLVAPVNLRAKILSATEVLLSWEDFADSDVGRTYTIRWGIHNFPYLTQYEYKKTSGQTAKFYGLKPNTEYEFSVKISDENQGESEYSPYITAKTLAAAPTSAPYAFKLIENDNEEILNVTWKPPTEPNGIITGYELYYTSGDSQSDLKYWQKANIDGNEKTYVVKVSRAEKNFKFQGVESSIFENVPRGKPLYLKMRAKNEVGPGPFSQLLVYQNNRESDNFEKPSDKNSFVIRPEQTEIRKNEGELLILSCEIDSNNGDKNHISVPLSWYFSNGSQIGLKDKHQRIHSTVMSRWKTALYFNPLIRTDTGSYFCGYNNARSNRKSISIQVAGSEPLDPTGCTFEIEDMCGWLPDPTGFYQWKWVKAGNFSEGLALIIPRDHTMIKSSLLEPAGHYMYLQAVDSEKGSGRLISPLLPASLSLQACLSFWYFVGDGSNGKLFIQTYPKDSLFTNISYLDEIDLKPTEREWKEIQIHLKPQSQDFRVVFEAVKDPIEELILAIDDVLISNTCKDMGGVKCESH